MAAAFPEDLNDVECKEGGSEVNVDSSEFGSDDRDDDYKNPLLIEVVTRKVFGYLNQDHLKSCRLVSHFWNILSIPFLKDECSFISFNNDNYWTNMQNHGIEDMQKFTDSVTSSSQFPFVKLDLGTSLIKSPADELTLVKFFQATSRIVKSLTIRDEFGQKLFSSPPDSFEFSSLEHLRIHFLQPMNDADDDITSNFEFITKIMEKAPILKKLSLIDHNGMDEGKVVTFFVDSIAKSNPKQLTVLEIEAQIETYHLLQLCKMGLKLKVLHLDFWGSIIKEDSLKLFLESQSETLEEMKISDFAMSSDIIVEFPCMKKVKRLIIKGSMLGRICITFPNVCYRKQFPVLKRLAFSRAFEEWDEFLKRDIQPVNSVEELKLPVDFADEDCLLNAVRIFPRITKLELPALLNLANIVYETMPDLEELTFNVKYIDVIDDIFTGLSCEICEEMTTYSPDMFAVIERAHLGLLSTKPISTLQRLKILRLKCRRLSDPVEITDVSCRLVLLKMKSLQYLDLCGRSPRGRISPNVLLDMQQKFIVLGDLP